MISCTKSAKSACQVTRSRRKPVRSQWSIYAYATNPAASIRRVAPGSSLHDAEAAVKTIGQAYVNHRWCREVQIRFGKEQDFFQGLARLHLDTFHHDPVLVLSEDCKAAGILLTDQQEGRLVSALQSLEFCVIAGTLQILQAMPEARLPKVTQQLQQLQQSSAQYAQSHSQSSYWKLICLGVRPEVQCQGFGRDLLAAVLAEAHETGKMLLVDAADLLTVQLLERKGFTTVGTCGIFTQLAWSPV